MKKALWGGGNDGANSKQNLPFVSHNFTALSAPDEEQEPLQRQLLPSGLSSSRQGKAPLQKL